MVLKHNIDIDELMKEYNQGKVRTVDMLPSGFANRNFRVVTEKGVFLLRECLEQDIKSIQQEMRLMGILKKHNFPTAYPIPAKNGSYLAMKQGTPFVLYEFIAGKTPEPGRDVIEAIAPAVAALNLIPISGDLIRKNALNYPSCLRLIASPVFKKSPYSEIKKQFKEEIDTLKLCLEVKLPVGLIHGDVFPDNTLFIGNELQAIIDFEEFAVDTLLFDVGMTINGFCFENNRIQPDLVDLFLKNYERVRMLTGKEKEMLPCYIRWTAVVMASWHIGKLLQKENKRQKERIQELLDRVKMLDQTLLNNIK